MTTVTNVIIATINIGIVTTITKLVITTAIPIVITTVHIIVSNSIVINLGAEGADYFCTDPTPTPTPTPIPSSLLSEVRRVVTSQFALSYLALCQIAPMATLSAISPCSMSPHVNSPRW